uniref:Uncharacterized protein n=1 Tax=Glossina pallidipes TaxID=7398 RepID=A0A1A9Z704_GLOPL
MLLQQKTAEIFQNLDFHTFSIILIAYCTYYGSIWAGAYCVYQKKSPTADQKEVGMEKKIQNDSSPINSCFICVKHLLLVWFGWMADLVCIRRRHLNKRHHQTWHIAGKTLGIFFVVE